MDKNMTLEKRIAAELYSYQGKMSVFVDDLHGHTVEIGADEEFETASTIKAYILAALYLQASRGKASLEKKITYKPEHFVDGSGMLRALGVGASLKVKDAATMMIVCSDNIATNMVIDYLGLDTINACIREMGLPTPSCTTRSTLIFTTTSAPRRPGTTPRCLRRWQRERSSALRPALRCWPSSVSSTTIPC